MKKKYTLIALTMMGLVIPFTMMLSNAAASLDFGGVNQFRDRWVAQDNLVGSPGVNRPYTWGPNVPNAQPTLAEPYADSPGGTRRVLYLDKARMEMNDPGTGFVTTGLAVKELVSGMRQDGNNIFTQLSPSQTQVAGDPVSANPDSPVYASFSNVVTMGNADSHSVANQTGSNINAFIAKNGTVSTIVPPVNLQFGAYETQTGHNIAAPFQTFKYQSGPVTDPATGNTLPNQPLYTTNPTSNVFGLAISEPYWVTTKIAGVDRIVLVQLFERRVLTYNPALATNQVEMGNVGQHYYQWRYVESTSTPNPTSTPTTKATPTPTTKTTPTTKPTATPTPTTPVSNVGNFNGTWNTNFALLGLTQQGDKVTGFYRRYGEVTNIQIEGAVSGNTLYGKATTYPDQTFSLELKANGSYIEGLYWGNIQWCGTKEGGSALPTGCGFTQKWYTNIGVLNLTQNKDVVTGNYARYDQANFQDIRGTVTGANDTPELSGYWGGITSQTLFFLMNRSGGVFDGHYGTNNQWCGVATDIPLPAGCGWSGKWNLSQTGTVANLVQTGATVTGTYQNGNTGTIRGSLTTYVYTLQGNWNINGRSGTFKWEMVDKGTLPQKFQGNYNTTNAWCGYRDGTTAPSPCLVK